MTSPITCSMIGRHACTTFCATSCPWKRPEGLVIKERSWVLAKSTEHCSNLCSRTSSYLKLTAAVWSTPLNKMAVGCHHCSAEQSVWQADPIRSLFAIFFKPALKYKRFLKITLSWCRYSFVRTIRLKFFKVFINLKRCIRILKVINQWCAHIFF